MKNLPVIQAPPPEAPAATQNTAALVADAAKTAELKPAIVKAISTVFDPEIPVNIWELGLIYDILVDANGTAGIRMTLTSPGCPSGPEIMGDAEREVRSLPDVGEVTVNLVWSPPWTPDRIEPRVRAYLGF